MMQGRVLPCFLKEKSYDIVIDIITSYAVLYLRFLHTKPKHVAGFYLTDE
jgi:hypothetical protein